MVAQGPARIAKRSQMMRQRVGSPAKLKKGKKAVSNVKK
jgi:hypothetical protein